MKKFSFLSALAFVVLSSLASPLRAQTEAGEAPFQRSTGLAVEVSVLDATRGASYPGLFFGFSFGTRVMFGLGMGYERVTRGELEHDKTTFGPGVRVAILQRGRAEVLGTLDVQVSATTARSDAALGETDERVMLAATGLGVRVWINPHLAFGALGRWVQGRATGFVVNPTINGPLTYRESTHHLGGVLTVTAVY